MSKKNKVSVRDRIKARAKAPRVDIDGVGEVGVRKLTVQEILDLGKLGDQEGSLALVAQCIEDESGELVFADAEEVIGLDMQTYKLLLVTVTKINGIENKVKAASGN